MMFAHNKIVSQSAYMSAHGNLCVNRLFGVRLNSLTLALVVLGLAIINLLLR